MGVVDPDSVVFRDIRVFVVPENQRKHACVNANMKNQFGGMTGFLTYEMKFDQKERDFKHVQIIGSNESVEDCEVSRLSVSWCVAYHHKKYIECIMNDWFKKNIQMSN